MNQKQKTLLALELFPQADLDVGFVGDGIYFAIRTEDKTPQENWDEACDIQNELNKNGLRLDNLYVDHDFIGGYLEEIAK